MPEESLRPLDAPVEVRLAVLRFTERLVISRDQRGFNDHETGMKLTIKPSPLLPRKDAGSSVSVRTPYYLR